MDRDEINTIYSELEASIASKQNKLMTVANEPCSVCQKKPKGNASCIVLSEQCLHHSCIDCIESKITEPIQNKLDERAKIPVDLVQCKGEDWCQVIIPLNILLPLLNLSKKEHIAEIERIKELYEESVCCVAPGNYQFIDQ